MDQLREIIEQGRNLINKRNDHGNTISVNEKFIRDLCLASNNFCVKEIEKEKWKRISVNIRDCKATYHIDYNEYRELLTYKKRYNKIKKCVNNTLTKIERRKKALSYDNSTLNISYNDYRLMSNMIDLIDKTYPI